MSNLSNQQINSSFNGLLQVPGGVTSSLQQVQDGNGNPTGLFVSSTDSTIITTENFVASKNGTAFTGAVPRQISDGFGDYLNVRDFGATGDGATDDTAAIQNAINAAQSNNGGSIYFPPGTYNVTSTFTLNTSNVMLVGAGSDTTHDAGTGVTPATIINYVGSPAITFYFFNFITTPNVNSSICVGGGMQGMFLSCNAKLAGGIQIISRRVGIFKNLNVYNPIVCAYRISCWKSGVEVPEAADTQRCIFENLFYRAIDSVPVRSAVGFILTSEHFPTSNANVSFCSFLYCQGQNYDAAGWQLYDADNNNFTSCSGGPLLPSSTKFAWDIWTDANNFYDISAGGFPSKIKIYGTASGNAYNPSSNSFLFSDNGNGTQYPNLDPGCLVYYQGQNGLGQNQRTVKAFVGDSGSSLNEYARTATNESLVVLNYSQANLTIADTYPPTNEWIFDTGTSFAGTGTSDFRVGQLAGTGYFCILNNTAFSANLFLRGIPTTAAAANLFVDTTSSPSGRVYRSTSSSRYKTNIETLDPNFSNNVLSLRPIWYRSTSDVDKKEWSWYGLLAEEVAEIEPRLVHWAYLDDDFEVTKEIDGRGIEVETKKLKENAKLVPDGVAYERLSVLLLDVVQRLEKRISELENKNV